MGFVAHPTCPTASSPVDHTDLSLELGEYIGAGRSAVVYAVNVLATESKSDSNQPVVIMPSPELCIKVARPNRCRTLAREAWIYEQLAEGVHQGVSVPRCYGFFTTELCSDQLPFPLWSNDDFYRGATWDDIDSDEPTHDDPLPDDDYSAIQAGQLGPGESSPWIGWLPDATKPLLSVLVMARGGRTYDLEDHNDRSTR